MPNRAPCIFCGKWDSRPSKEDVIPKWIARKFGKQNWENKSIHSNRVFTTRGTLGLFTRAPCTRCNNEWMSQLESEAKPILGPLIDGVPTELTTEQQRIVALWFLKTCIVHEALHDENPRYFRWMECRMLMKFRMFPPITWVFLGRYIGSGDILTREQPMNLELGEADTANPQSAYGYSVTFAINQLALQIFTVRPPENFNLGNIGFKMSPDWHRATVQIWPPIGPVNWPPPAAFDDAGFELLTDRWRMLKP